MPTSTAKKLKVIYRIEPGCLGPQGESHIIGFCDFAQKNFQPAQSELFQFEIVPRRDKSQPEKQYNINDKKLPHDKVTRLLDSLDKNINEFEDELDEHLVSLIELYFDNISN